MGQDPATTVWLVRHGLTGWARDGRHTSTTDVPLTPAGEAEARALAGHLGGQRFSLVLTSPRKRSRTTAALAGFPDAQVEPDLAEWDYGELEGLTTDAIRERIPGWRIWTHGAPGGETPAEVTRRYDRLVDRLRGLDGPVLCFGHGHGLRVLAIRWIGQEVTLGGALSLGTASVSALGLERGRPAIIHWNT